MCSDLDRAMKKIGLKNKVEKNKNEKMKRRTELCIWQTR